MKKLLLFSLLLTLNFSFAQDKTGYWDTNRKTSSTIKLSKGQLGHLEVKLPKGTTEIAYRIVPTSKYIGALDDFSEALKNLGDKRALAAGYTASFISKLSNDVKCKYGVFNDIKSITNFYSNSDFSKGCHVKFDLINKYEVNILRKQDSPCLFNSPSSIWFAFKSENLVFDQDVIVEIIPWIDNSTLSSVNNNESFGKTKQIISDNSWSETERNQYKAHFFNALKKDFDEAIANDVSTCMTDKIVKDYSPSKLNSMQSTEKETLFLEVYKLCISSYQEAKTPTQEKGMTFGNLGWKSYENGDLDKAIEYSEKALTFDNTLGFVKANLGLFYMIKGNDSKAIDFYVDAISDLKKDKLNTKRSLIAAIDDIDNALLKNPKLNGFKIVKDMLSDELKNY